MIHELSGRDIHHYTVNQLKAGVDLQVQGYCMSKELAWDILLKAGSEGRSLTSVSRELAQTVHANTL